jgi:hypothetical protein
MADENGQRKEMRHPDEQEVSLQTLSDAQLLSVYYSIPGSLVGRATLSSIMGKQYSGDRNVYEALGYPTDEELEFKHFYSRYKRQDMAKAIIDKPVNATWRGGLRIKEAGERGDKELTEFEQAYEDLDRQVGLRNWFTRLDKLTGLGHFGILLMGFDDVKGRRGYQRPIKRKSELVYVKAFGDQNVEIKTWERDPANPRYGMPLTYEVEVSGPHTQTSEKIIVHYSRVLHIVDGNLESDIYGEPRLEVVFNRLMDLEKVTGGDAEMFWRGARPGYAGTEQEGFELTPGQREVIQEQIKEYEHNQRRFLIAKGLELEALAQQVADPSSHVDVQVQMISAVTGIPKRILVGSERGELASTEDRTQWLSEIKTRREEFAEAKIVRPFIDKCIELGVLPQPDTGDFTVLWEDLFAPSDKEKAEIGNTRAEALMYYARYPFASELLLPKVAFKKLLGMSDDEIEEAMQERGGELGEEELRKIVEESRSRPGGDQSDTSDPEPEQS